MDFTTKEIAHKIAAAACDKKAKDILLLNMENQNLEYSKAYLYYPNRHR